MPIFKLTGCSAKSRAICGNAVAMTVASRFSMKKVMATSKAMKVGCRGAFTSPSGD